MECLGLDVHTGLRCVGFSILYELILYNIDNMLSPLSSSHSTLPMQIKQISLLQVRYYSRLPRGSHYYTGRQPNI